MLRNPVLALLALAACTRAPAPTPGANVLLLTLDTVRADALGAYGSATPTPHLDRLANEGARFEAAYTVTPLTIPAHASLFTSRWPPRHGVRDNGEAFLGDDAVTLAEVLRGAGYATMASVGAEVTSHHWGFGQGFDAFFDDMGTTGAGSRKWKVERRADAVVRDALAWLRPRAAEPKPWFAWIHVYDAHDPYRPPEPYASTYRETPYAGEVAWVDAQVGELLTELQTLGELDDTWVVVVSDHGESLGEHGEETHGVLLYEGATRIPFLVRPPRGAAPVAPTLPVSLVDVMPTVLAAVGVAPPEGMDGRDLLPLLGGAAPADPDRAVYAESLYAWRHFGWAPQYALMTPSHTLIASTTPELYARADRKQAQDLAASDPATLSALAERLAALQASMGPPTTASRSEDPRRTAMLEALGYLATESTAGRDATGAPLPGLPDPVDRLPVLADVERAKVAYRAGDMAGALAAANKAAATDPDIVETQLLAATIEWRTGDPAAALARVAAIDAKRPSSQTRHLLGLLELALGRPEAAAPLLADAVARDPFNASATETWLQTLLILEDFAALRPAADLARTNLPDSAIVSGMAGVAHALGGDAATARPLLEAAIAKKPDQPFVHHGLGVALRALGDEAGARAAFEEEIRRYPPARPSRQALSEMGVDLPVAGERR